MNRALPSERAQILQPRSCPHGSQVGACVHACLRACVPACLRACLPTYIILRRMQLVRSEGACVRRRYRGTSSHTSQPLRASFARHATLKTTRPRTLLMARSGWCDQLPISLAGLLSKIDTGRHSASRRVSGFEKEL